LQDVGYPHRSSHCGNHHSDCAVSDAVVKEYKEYKEFKEFNEFKNKSINSFLLLPTSHPRKNRK
jgi:hypothetical protein